MFQGRVQFGFWVESNMSRLRTKLCPGQGGAMNRGKGEGSNGNDRT